MATTQFSRNTIHSAIKMAAVSMNLSEVEGYRLIADKERLIAEEQKSGKPGTANKWYALMKINEFFGKQNQLYREAFDIMASAGIKPAKVLDLFGESGLGTAAIADRYPKAEVVCRQDNQRHKIAEVSGIFFQGRRIYGPLSKENFDTVFAIGRPIRDNLVEAEFYLMLAMKQTGCLYFVIDGFEEEGSLLEFTKKAETLGWKYVNSFQGAVVLERPMPKESKMGLRPKKK